MTDSVGKDRGPTDPPGAVDDDPLRKLARDWITLWQTELSALARDRDTWETWQTTQAFWLRLAEQMLRARPGDPPRPAPTAAAPDARDAEVERLGRHVASLEQRLAELERGRGPSRRPRKPRG